MVAEIHSRHSLGNSADSLGNSRDSQGNDRDSLGIPEGFLNTDWQGP